MWETVAQAVINGLLIGGIYALVSIGVTLIFGVVKIVNFAQGEFVMIGMYISFFLANQFGIDPLLSLLVSMPVLFVAGVLIQHFLIRRVLGPNDMPQIFLTFALSLLLLNLALMLFTANYRTVHTSYSDEAFHIGGLYIPIAKLIAFVVAMGLSGVLWLFLHTTDLGKAMRAASQNKDVAMLMGINPNRVFCVALGIALALAGAAGSLLMPFYSAYPFVGQVFVLMAFVAVVLGTLGNVMGGYAKQLSLGHAAYFGLGAYTSTILQIDYNISPWLGMIAGGVVAMLASLPIGWLCFRLRGPYFTIATIATAQALMLIFLKFRDLAWGAEGTTIPNLGNAPLMMQFDSKAAYYYVVLGLLALGLLITYLIERSWMGYYLVAIGEDEDAAEAIGVNAPRIKRDIYLISSFLTALAGTFYTQYIYFIDPATAFSFNISIEAALVSIVGGIGTLWGPVIGTVLLETTSTLLQSWLGSSIGGVQLTVYSLILMAVILWRPTGLMGMIDEVRQRLARPKPARA